MNVSGCYLLFLVFWGWVWFLINNINFVIFLCVLRVFAEAVPKPPIPLVGHGFSRAKMLVIIYFANLKVNPMECETIPSRVCPTLKNLNFGTLSAVQFTCDNQFNLWLNLGAGMGFKQQKIFVCLVV